MTQLPQTLLHSEIKNTYYAEAIHYFSIALTITNNLSHKITVPTHLRDVNKKQVNELLHPQSKYINY
jgi:hypothetical protein